MLQTLYSGQQSRLSRVFSSKIIAQLSRVGNRLSYGQAWYSRIIFDLTSLRVLGPGSGGLVLLMFASEVLYDFKLTA